MEGLGTVHNAKGMTSQEQARYSKQIILPEVGAEGQERLKAAKVLVIGAGGLGCPILQYLTAAGVGTIGIADGDKVEISNLQRQVLYSEEELGQSKAEVAAKKIKRLNPHTEIKAYTAFIDSGNALQILQEYDIIVDGSDNFSTRYLVNDACVILDKPMVSGAIYKFEGQVSVFNYKGGPTYRCLFPEPPQAGESPNCANIGVIASLPGIIGTIQANEVIKVITGIGEPLSGRLMVIDTLTMHTHIFNYTLNPENKNIHQLRDQSFNCGPTAGMITYDSLQRLIADTPDIQLVDVRETEEHAIGNIGGINIPLSRLETDYSSLDPNKTTILYCASGIRSNKSAHILLGKGFQHVFNLKDGINALGHL